MGRHARPPTVVDTGEATQIDASGPAYDAARAAFAEAWDGTAPVDMGVGGSIPFIAEFLEAFPQASVLVTGVEDPDTRAHGANEGLHLAEFEKVVPRRGAAAAQPRQPLSLRGSSAAGASMRLRPRRRPVEWALVPHAGDPQRGRAAMAV